MRTLSPEQTVKLRAEIEASQESIQELREIIREYGCLVRMGTWRRLGLAAHKSV